MLTLLSFRRGLLRLEHRAPDRSQWDPEPRSLKATAEKGDVHARGLAGVSSVWEAVEAQNWALLTLNLCSFTKPPFSASVSPSRVPICLSAGKQVSRATLPARTFPPLPRAGPRGFGVTLTLACTGADPGPHPPPPLPPESSGSAGPRVPLARSAPLKVVCTLERDSG